MLAQQETGSKYFVTFQNTSSAVSPSTSRVSWCRSKLKGSSKVWLGAVCRKSGPARGAVAITLVAGVNSWHWKPSRPRSVTCNRCSTVRRLTARHCKRALHLCLVMYLLQSVLRLHCLRRSTISSRWHYCSNDADSPKLISGVLVLT